MLSAAFDIIKENDHKSDDNSNEEKGFKCNTTSTGAVLLADILPCLLIKLLAPFVFTNTNVRVFIVVILSALSFIITSFATNIFFSYIGIISASLSSGLGETTFLAFTSHFNSGVISFWSSGTGASGLLGSTSYALLTSIGLSPKKTLLIMIVIPIVMAITFWGLIVPENNENSVDESTNCLLNSENQIQDLLADQNSNEDDIPTQLNSSQTNSDLTFIEMANYTKNLFKYMIPLMMVYFFEYFINQGLFELVYFPDIWLTHSQQYRWYQVVYQIGVLISRSSISLIQFKRIYILAILQGFNVSIILIQIFNHFMPTIWIMFTIVLFEGLLGGAAYVNTFYLIYNEVHQRYKEFSLSIVTLSDSIGITIAGATALPVHDILCKIIKYRK